MQKALLIAEKPSLMKDIQNAYNHCRDKVPYEITFTSQVGHLVELLDPVELNPEYKSWDVSLLPINPGKEGGWQYKVKHSTKDVYQQISKEVKSGKYDVIIHAGDPDQEGELLVRLVLQKIGNTLPVIRFWSNDTTPTGLEQALQNMKSDSDALYENFYHAALIRQHADWLMGMNGSRAIADRIYAGRDNKIAAGRVMTWVQTAVVDREDEIQNFVPKTVYGVKATFENGLEGSLYENPLIASSDSKEDKEDKESAGIVYFETKAEAENVINKLEDSGTVVSVERKQISTYAPKLYKLATIQMDASKIGLSASETLEVIQSLYEKHYVSYPRTDCEVLSSNENFRAIIASASVIKEYEDAANYAIGQISRIIGMKKYVNDKELAKHGHSALVPTNLKPDLSALTAKELAVYKLIAKRFLAIFQPPLIQDKVVVLTDNGGYEFRSSGKTVIDPGYTTFTGETIQDVPIPNVNEGDVLTLLHAEVSDKTSTCPKRFTSGTLIAAMENPGKYLVDESIKDSVKNLTIGTPATRGAIIDKLIKDKFIQVDSKGIISPTDFGSFMIHTIRGISLCRIDTTGQWEQMLSKVKDGEFSLGQAELYMENQVDELLKDVKGVNKVSYGDATSAREPIMVCPGCGKDIMEAPRNYYCTGYKDGCKFSIMKEFLSAKFTPDDVRDLFNGKEIEKKLTKKDGSGTWNQKLKFDSEEGRLTFVQATEKNMNVCCPECGETLFKKGIRVECHGCGFGVWTQIAKKELTDGQLEFILNNGHSDGKIKGFIKKDGGKFDAKLKLEKNGKDSKITFDFK